MERFRGVPILLAATAAAIVAFDHAERPSANAAGDPWIELQVAGDCTRTAAAATETTFWEGRGKSKAVFNFDGTVFWEGRGKHTALANIRGQTAWKERSVLVAILNVDSNKVAWEGNGRSKALFSIDQNGVVWEGRGRSKAIANFDGRTIWEGRGRSKALANWDGDRFDDPAMFTAIWLLLRAD